jgi:molybdopterin-guanine dinucleotide biosynthesis protein A
MARLQATLALTGAPGPAPEIVRVRELFDEVLLCADRPRDHLALEITLVSPSGPPPLGAIWAALTVARHETVVVAERPGAHLAALATAPGDVVLQEPGQLTPGCYRRPCLRRLERALRAGQSGDAVLRGLRVTIAG